MIEDRLDSLLEGSKQLSVELEMLSWDKCGVHIEIFTIMVQKLGENVEILDYLLAHNMVFHLLWFLRSRCSYLALVFCLVLGA